MKDLGSFGPQPDMIFREMSSAASLTLRGWGRKRGTAPLSLLTLCCHWTINTDQQLLSAKSHLKSNSKITLRGRGK